MIKTYRKNPVEIDAIQFTGENYTEVMLFVGKQLESSRPPAQMEKEEDVQNEGYNIIIPTLEGDMTAIKLDYIIKGVKGEFYPCKPDIFEVTYSEVTRVEGSEFRAQSLLNELLTMPDEGRIAFLCDALDSERSLGAIQQIKRAQKQ